MSKQSYPLIGRDRNGNEYPREVEHLSEGKAAERYLELDTRVVEVLCGDRSPRGKGNHYKKVIRVRNGFHRNNETTALGQALGGSGLSVAHMIIKNLEQRGLSLDIVDNQDGGETLVISPSGKATDIDKADITDHEEALVSIVRARQEPNPDEHVASAGEMGRGPTKKEILAKILPQMPTPFRTDDFELRLRECGFTRFADDRISINNALATGCNTGMIERLSKGVYKRAVIFDQSTQPPAPAKEEPVAEAPSRPIDPKMAALEALFPKKPEAAPAPPVAPEQPLPPAPATPPPQASVVPPIGVPVNLLAAFAALSSSALVGPVDLGAISEIKEAFTTFEDEMQQAVINLESKLNPFLDKLAIYGNTHAQLLTLLSPPKTTL